MSSPVNDEHHDKRTMYAPPWARETAERPSSYNLAKNDVIDDIYARIFAAGPSQSGADVT